MRALLDKVFDRGAPREAEKQRQLLGVGVNHATNFSRTGEEGFKSLKLRVQVNGRAEAVQPSARKFFADHVAVHESEDEKP